MPRTSFPLFDSHLDLAHEYWEALVKSGDIVIDSTCGHGKDSLKLARLALQNGTGQLYSIDIQQEALFSAQTLLSHQLSPQQMQQITFIRECHSQFPKAIREESVKLIVYNLGYLPKGDKGITTMLQTTLESIKQAQKLLIPGGAISITCYPGHLEGAREEEALLLEVSNWEPHSWSCCHHRWLNRKHSPSLLILQKALEANSF